MITAIQTFSVVVLLLPTQTFAASPKFHPNKKGVTVPITRSTTSSKKPSNTHRLQSKAKTQALFNSFDVTYYGSIFVGFPEP